MSCPPTILLLGNIGKQTDTLSMGDTARQGRRKTAVRVRIQKTFQLLEEKEKSFLLCAIMKSRERNMADN